MAEVGKTRAAPLAGVRVLDFGHILAGPYCARLLADLGADVLKIESRSRAEGMGRTRLGESYRGRRDRSPHMLMTNRDKRSVTLDLKTSAGRELATRLIGAADVLVENFSAGTMDKLGLGQDAMRAANPRLIYLSLSGYGHHGPRRDWTSMNLNLQAYSGMMMTTGAEDDPPTTLAASWNDYLGALHGCAGILNALLERKTTGQGMYLDMSQFECSVAALAPLVLASAVQRTPPPRTANRSRTAAPQGVYRCAEKDQWCVISVKDDVQWRALAGVLEDIPELTQERFSSLAGRVAHHDELDRLIEKWTSVHAPAEVEGRLRAAGVRVERMRRSRDILDGETGKRLYEPVEDPPGYCQLMSRVPLHFERATLPSPSRAPLIGEHTAEVLAEWLGLDGTALDPYLAAGALV